MKLSEYKEIKFHLQKISKICLESYPGISLDDVIKIARRVFYGKPITIKKLRENLYFAKVKAEIELLTGE